VPQQLPPHAGPFGQPLPAAHGDGPSPELRSGVGAEARSTAPSGSATHSFPRSMDGWQLAPALQVSPAQQGWPSPPQGWQTRSCTPAHTSGALQVLPLQQYCPLPPQLWLQPEAAAASAASAIQRERMDRG
jgi:hypothetical protein